MTYLHAKSEGVPLTLNFTLPLRNAGQIDQVIATEARTHQTLTRAQIYARFAPPSSQVTALRNWLVRHGYTITHVGADNLAVEASAPTATVERTLALKVNVYRHVGFMAGRHRQAAYDFYANTTAPRVPARLGIATISGLTSVDRFYTEAQLTGRSKAAVPPDGENPDLRTGGYFPSDLRSLYDVSSHGINGSGETIGFTLWDTGITQAALTAYSNQSGDTPVTLDADCNSTGQSGSVPNACNTEAVQPDHLVNVYESSAPKNNYSVEDEIGLDVESAHGIAPGVAMKYYLTDNSDAGLETALEDAADDPTLHSVSNSWGGGGDEGDGLAEPFVAATNEILQVAAMAGTTFYFSTGDDGTYLDGYPADSPYVVAVGGSSVFSTSSDPGTFSNDATWGLGGSWCSDLEPRPSWQTGPGVAADTQCTGRATPDISADADPGTGFHTTYATGASTTGAGDIGGTSLAAPLMNGMEADTENFLNLQTYPGATPAIGFEAPTMYQLGNSGHASSYYRDLTCGNTEAALYGPDGDAAKPGWDNATGWGEIDWLTYSTGYALALGATGLSIPPSIARSYNYGCARTPTNAYESGIAMASTNVGFALGSVGLATGEGAAWASQHLPSNVWGADNTFLATADGGSTWTASNADMLGVACPTSTTCIEVGDGGAIKITRDGGTTWTAMTSPVDKALTSISCPSAAVCFAAGDRGAIIKSVDGGVSWSLMSSGDGNPIFGLSCPTAQSCFATNYWGLIDHTSNGGASWQYESNPVSTGGLYSLIDISCSSDQDCAAVGNFADGDAATVHGDPIITTTDGGSSWQSATWSGAGAFGVDCVTGSTTCYAVGNAGSIEISTNGGGTWSAMTSNTGNLLTGIYCADAADCVATGQNGTVDVLAAGVWTATTSLGSSDFMAGVTCTSATACLAVGKQGMTLGFNPSNMTSVTQQAGGGTVQQMQAISCGSSTRCATVGAAGAIVTTSDAGQSWLPRTSGTSQMLLGVGCAGTTCVADGAAGVILASSDRGTTWTVETSGVSSQLDAVTCSSSMACVATGVGGTILTTSDGGITWVPQSSGTTAEIAAVTCSPSSCYAVGALPAGGSSAVILSSGDGGVTWVPQTSNSPQPLDAIACVSDAACFAGGASGTVVTTVDGGAAWTQQGNPLSGPTSALAADYSGALGLLSASCTSSRCVFGAQNDGDIMTTPLLTVTVTASGAGGSDPDLSGLSASDPAISYGPSGQAANVTGTLTCTTTATGASPVGSYPVSECSGLSDPGYSVVYDLDDSSYTVGKSAQSITFAAISGRTYGAPDFDVSASASSGLAVTFAATGSGCTVTSAGHVSITHAGSCTVIASQPGNASFSAAPDVSQQVTVAKATPSVSVTATSAKKGAVGVVTYHVSVISAAPAAPTGSVTVSDGARTCKIASLSPAGVGSCGIPEPAGKYSVTAAYSGDGNFSAASGGRHETVARAHPTLTLGEKVGKHTAKGRRVTFTVHVSGVKGFEPTGMVSLSDQHGTLCRATKLSRSGAMSCTVTLRAGSYQVVATYAGNSNYVPGSKAKHFHVPH